MTEDAVRHFVAALFPGVDVVTPREGDGSPAVAWGDTFFIYDPEGTLEPAHRFPFATIVTKDYGNFDRASHLDRPGVFRLNIGVSRETYTALFGPPPRPDSAGGVQAGYDFTALDRLMPHPVYSPQAWVAVLNPSEDTLRQIRPLLEEAYARAVRRANRGI